MPDWKKLKGALDWVAYGKLLVELGLAFTGSKFGKILLSRIDRLSPEWVSPLSWLIGVLILWLLLRFWRAPLRKRDAEQRSGAGTSLAAANAEHSLPQTST